MFKGVLKGELKGGRGGAGDSFSFSTSLVLAIENDWFGNFDLVYSTSSHIQV